ncbi:MAG: hypothetical protein RL013_2355 [Bacteroidota bacterium]|jgi:hypothetical protein
MVKKIPDTDEQNPVICLSGNKTSVGTATKKQPSALSPLKEPEGPRLRFSLPSRAFFYSCQPVLKIFDNF